jgi:hypothetical protein
MKKGDKVSYQGRDYIVVSTSDDATPMQRLKAQIRCVRLLQWAGIPPVVPEHIALAERLRQFP